MGRYLGAKHAMCRRVGEKLCTAKKCPVTKRNYPKGVHGPAKAGMMTRRTEYGTQLLEKQKAKHVYGILERQFKRYYTESMKKTGDTGVYLLGFLERRLDNILYRMGVVQTRAQARQMIGHGHVKVNGIRVNRPSYQVAMGDEIVYGKGPKEQEERAPVSWLSFDKEAKKGKVTSMPKIAELPERLNMRLIIEHYSR